MTEVVGHFDRAGWVLVDVVWKSTVLLLTVYALDQFLLKRRPLVADTIWSATIVVLALLPICCLAPPRFVVPISSVAEHAATQGGAPSRNEASQFTVPRFGRGVVSTVEHAATPADTSNSEPSEIVRGPLPPVRDGDVIAPRAISPGQVAVEPTPVAAKLKPRVGVAQPNIASLIALVYFLGLAVAGLRLVTAFFSLSRLRRNTAEVFSDSWKTALRDCTRRLGVRRDVVLCQSSSISVPLTFGWRRPAVIVPSSSVGGTTRGTIEAVLLHELTHIVRGDYPMHLVTNVVLCIHWYNPLIWLASRRLSQSREAVCDGYCISSLGDRERYVRVLLDYAQRLGERSQMALGLAMIRASRLERRLANLMPVPRYDAGVAVRLASLLTAFAVTLSLGVTAFAQKAADHEPLPEQPRTEALARVIEGLKLAEQTIASLVVSHAIESQHNLTEPGKPLPAGMLIEDEAVSMQREGTVTWEVARDGRGRMEARLRKTNSRFDGSQVKKQERYVSTFDGRRGEFARTVSNENGVVVSRDRRYTDRLVSTSSSPFDFVTQHLGKPVSEVVSQQRGRLVESTEWEQRTVVVVETSPVTVRDDYIYRQQFWIDPQRNHLVVRRRTYVQRGERKPWELHLQIDLSEVEEVSPGIWLPATVDKWNYHVTTSGQGHLVSREHIEVSEWTVNKVLDPSRFEIGLGASRPEAAQVEASKQGSATAPGTRTTRLDSIGDPLPEAAIFRFGTTRFQHPSSVVELALSPDEKTVISFGSQQLIAWEAETGKQKWNADVVGLHLSAASYGVHPITFLGGDKFLTSGVEELWLWDAATGDAERIRPGKPRDARGARIFKSIDASPEGRLLAAGSSDGLLVCRPDGEIVYEITNRPRQDIQVADAGSDRLTFGGEFSYAIFSPDGKTLAAVFSEAPREIRVMKAATGVEIRRIKTTSRLVRMDFSPNGQRIVASERDIATRMYDVATGKQQWEHVLEPMGTAESYTSTVAFSPDSKLVAVGAPLGSDYRIRLLDAATGQEVGSLTGHQWKPWTLAFTADSKMLYSSGWDGIICRWDLDAQELLDLPQGLRATGTCAASPDGEWVAFVDNAGKIHVTDAQAGRTIRTLSLAGDGFSQLAFSSNGRLLAAGGVHDGMVRVAVWDLVDGQLLRYWEWPKGRDPHSTVNALDFTKDGRRLAAAVFRQSKSYVWDLPSGGQIAELRHGRVYGLAFSPNNTTLATVGWDRIIRLWNVTTGETLQSKELPNEGPDTRMYGVRFSPIGDTLATAHLSGHVRLWNPDDLTVRTTFEVEGRFVHGTIDFSPEGLFVATGGMNGQVDLWDALTGQRVWSRGQHDHHVDNVSFGSSFQTLLTGGSDNVCYLWDLRPEHQINKKLTEHYDDMVGADAVAAFHACWALAANPDATVKLFAEKLASSEISGEPRAPPDRQPLPGERRAIMLLRHLETPAAVTLIQRIKEDNPQPSLRRLAADVLDSY